MSGPVQRHRFSVDDYHRMGEIGLFGEDDRVELLHGEVVVMSPIGARHAACVARLGEAFEDIRSLVIRWTRNPVELDDSEPEPDFALLNRRDDFYAGKHPGPRDILLVVEVSDTSQLVDREVKVPLYGGSGIPECWLVDLAKDRIEVYREPSKEGYRSLETVGRVRTLSPVSFPEFALRVDNILP